MPLQVTRRRESSQGSAACLARLCRQYISSRAHQLPRIARIHQARLSMLVFCVKRRKERQNRLIRYASRHEGTHVFIFSCADLL